jgi:Fe2+ or Zn2+ uptake regulation protein
MKTIEEILRIIDVDWDVDPYTGLHVIDTNDYDDYLLTDINIHLSEPVEMLNFGGITMICPKNRCEEIVNMMSKIGYELDRRRTDNKMLTENRKRLMTIVEQASDEMSSDNIFKQFSKAMKILGEQLGVGPLQTKLRKRGILYKLNKDKDSLIFYVKNDKGEKQPIARISKTQLKTQNDFRNHLEMMVDMATGKPPGTMKSEQDKLREKQNIISDLARVVFPSDKSSQVANMMLSKD